MADFSALKTAIQTYIKQNGNEEITGEILQEILLSMVTTLGDSAINDLVTALTNEVAARQNADGTLQTNITNEATARGNADTALQGLINGITGNIENGYVYAGIATPSSTPVTGKVFYLALTAGTYTNFGSTVVSQGINILKYNGSAWSLDAFIGIDDTPTPNSPKLVKSGGTFESVMTNGSAFDISAHFASGGTLATYADLSAALTAFNTLSAPYKRGGMSIKFVQSSDNRYKRYWLTKNEFSTDPYDWLGVDDDLNILFGTRVTYGIKENVLIYANGTTAGAPSTRWAASDFIPVNEGDTFAFKGGSGTTDCLGISAYSSNEQSSFIQGSSANIQYKTTATEIIVAIIPAGVNFIRLNLDRQVVGSISSFEVMKNSKITQMEYSIGKLDTEVGDIKNKVDSELGEMRELPLTENVLIYTDGTTAVAPSTYWGATDFIPVDAGDIISFVGGSGDICLAVSAYSSNTQSSFISGSTANIPYSTPYSQGGGAVEKITVIIPAGVNYIRLCKDRRILAGNSIEVTFNSRFDEQDKRITELESEENAEKIIGLPLFKLSDNFSNPSITTSWQKNTDNYYSNSLTGVSNAFKVNKQYALIDAIFMFDFKGAANSRLHFGTADGSTMFTDIIIDYSTNKLIVKSQTDIEESAAFNSDHKHRLQVTMNNGALKASVYDLLDYTLVAEITDNSDKSGRMAYNPICYCESGSMYLYDFISDCKHNESGIYRLLITGDSITHGTAAEPLTNGYALLVQNALGIDKVKISAHSGGNIDNVLARIDDELSHLKVKFVMVMIGTNGGNTIDKLNQLLNKIVSYDAVPILNHIPCDWYNEYIGSTEPPLYLARNEMIDLVIAAYPIKVDCCKMDLATSIGHVLSGGCNKAIYYDTVHPDTPGHLMMFNQVKIDCPFLFD